jgi:transposase
MRKSFNTLRGLVAAMGHEVIAGEAFLFVARNRRRAKVLWHDDTGLCLLAKRLDKGTFACLWSSESAGATTVKLSLNELRLFVEGSKLVGKMPLSPEPPDPRQTTRVSRSTFA